MSLEAALADSAGGDFGLLLIAVLVVSLLSCFFWAIKKLLDQNAGFNSQLLKQNADSNALIMSKLQEIVEVVYQYRGGTEAALGRHDDQAKKILEVCRETQTTLRNRPCIKDAK